MPSFGEADVIVNSTIVGKVRVNALYAGSTLYPRLCLRIGVGLRDVAPNAIQGVQSLQGYAMTDLHGELRLGESSDVIGSMSWSGERCPVRSSSTGYETAVVCGCDLDYARLELIERRRDGTAPTFALTLWPVLVSASEQLNCQVSSLSLQVPREVWLEFVRAASGGEFDVLEFQYGPGEREYFKRGLALVRAAREKVRDGAYDEAVGLCRKVLEAAAQEYEPGRGTEPLKRLFERVAGEKRGGEYAGIVSKLKQLAVDAHHAFGEPIAYSRGEAQFIVRVTAATLSLAANFAANAPPSSAAPA